MTSLYHEIVKPTVSTAIAPLIAECQQRRQRFQLYLYHTPSLPCQLHFRIAWRSIAALSNSHHSCSAFSKLTLNSSMLSLEIVCEEGIFPCSGWTASRPGIQGKRQATTANMGISATRYWTQRLRILRGLPLYCGNT
jgi:hypothetical protein